MMKAKLLGTAVGVLALWVPSLTPAHAQSATTESDEEIVVTATRSLGSIKDLPIKVDVFNEEEVRLQQTLAVNNTELLSNLVPSFAPSRQKLTGGGETFRGRTPLYLIDGVPQSTPLRPGAREGVTIDLEVIERVEVLFGANALQGLGGTGGVINYVTVNAPRDGRLEQRAAVGLSANDSFNSDGIGWRAHYLAAKDFGKFDAVAAISYEERGLLYDGEGRAIGIDNESGDIADTDSLNLFAKFGWEPTEDQRLQIMANDFYIAQNGNYVRVNGNRSLGIPAVSVKGTPRGELPFNDVQTVSLDYSHRDFLGGRLSVQGYYQDFHSLFGGQAITSFQDPLIAPIGTLFDQTQNNSEKYGAKFTFGRTDIAGFIDAIVGVDLLRDKTSQPLVVTNRVSVPPTTFYNYAPFLQLSVDPLDWLTITGGVRYESGTLKVPDFVSRAGNRSDFQRVPVEGGTRRFNDTLFNAGAVVDPTENLSFYASYSQAFSMPDIGRVLRSVSQFGTSVDTLLDIGPIVATNKEIGGEFKTEILNLSLSYFVSSSDFGQMLIARPDGTFDLGRQAIETSGWEATAKLRPTDWLGLGASYSLLNGRFDSNSDGRLDADLGAADIGPDRLSLFIDVTPEGPISGRLQSFSYFDKSFQNRLGATTASFEGYTTVDASVSANLDPFSVTLAISNLFDKQYFTYHAQAATGSNALYYAGRGRALTLRLAATF